MIGNSEAQLKPAPDFRLSTFEGFEAVNHNRIDAENEDEITNLVYIPTWENKPIERDPVCTLNGTPILTYQNTSAIIAAPGHGKSSICEALGAHSINPECDALGFRVSPDVGGVLIIDTERTQTDVWNSFSRMHKRACIPDGKTASNVVIAGLRNIPRPKQKIEAIKKLLDEQPAGLLIIDGAGDLAADTNDLLEAIEVRIILRDLSVQYNLSIFTTLHPNPGSTKPRGHIGSEIHRECECVLVAKPYEGETRIITSEFDFGKNRNNAPITGGYKWSDQHRLFIACDIDEEKAAKQASRDKAKYEATRLIITECLPAPKSLGHTELTELIMRHTQKEISSAKTLIRNASGWGLINKGSDGNYRQAV